MLVWGRKEDCELVSAILPAVLELLPEPPPGAAAPLPLAEPRTIEGLMTRASLSPFASDEVDHALVYGDMASAWRAFAAAAPCVRAVRHAGEAIVRDTVLARLAPFRRADGTVALKNRFRLVAGERS
jgi:hypothetical protein